MNETTTMQIVIRVGEYALVPQADYIWLENKDGEGMSFHFEEFERLLDNHFKENF